MEAMRAGQRIDAFRTACQVCRLSICRHRITTLLSACMPCMHHALTYEVLCPHCLLYHGSHDFTAAEFSLNQQRKSCVEADIAETTMLMHKHACAGAGSDRPAAQR